MSDVAIDPARAAADESHLKLLAIFHYVYAGLTSIGGCVGLLYVVIGGAIAVAPSGGNAGDGDARVAGGVMLGMGVLVLVICAAIAGLIIYSARCISSRRHRVFSLVVAGLMCLSVPLGTTLGVFTIIVLVRRSVVALYERAA